MKRLFFILPLMALLVFPGMAKEKKEKSKAGKEEVKEAKFGATPYIYTGPDTGFGVGASGLFRDLFKKEGRDMVFSVSYTEKRYEYYSIEWKEPKIFSDNAWLRIYVKYANEPTRLYYGLGNDSERDNACYFGEREVEVNPRFDYWFWTGEERLGIKADYRYSWFKPRDGPEDLDEPEISEQFPGVYNSDEFQDGGQISGIGVLLVYDDRKDKFPIGGGRDEVIFPYLGGRQELYLARYDKIFGSDWDYTLASVNLTYHIPLGWEWTVLSGRANLTIKDGDMPFWELSSFGSENTIRGYHGGRFRDHHSVLFNIEFRQAFDYSFHPLPWGALKAYKITAPMVVLFFDYGRVFNEIEDIFSEFEDYHWTYGISGRFIISPSVVIRFDQAFSEEESDFYITAGWTF